jgi:hypothetical protein
MDTGNFISQLRDIRSTLKEALLNSENLESKLVGPTPAQVGEKGNSPKPVDSIAQILGDISRLSVALVRSTTRPHEILGDFAPMECGQAPAGRLA